MGRSGWVIPSSMPGSSSTVSSAFFKVDGMGFGWVEMGLNGMGWVGHGSFRFPCPAVVVPCTQPPARWVMDFGWLEFELDGMGGTYFILSSMPSSRNTMSSASSKVGWTGMDGLQWGQMDAMAWIELILPSRHGGLTAVSVCWLVA